MGNRAVLVTGAAKRIGKAIAISMAKAGWNIGIHYNTSQTEAADTIKHIESIGVKACLVQADLGNEKQARGIIEQVNKQIGVVTCLVNNASVLKNDTIQNFTSASWDENMAVNLYAPTILMQEFIKQLPNSGGGNIINMLDYSVWRYPEKFVSYTASKAALWALTQQLAYSLAKHGVRVNAIGPGNALPNQFESDKRFQESRLASPLAIGTDPEEICRTLHFILSCPSMTGQMIALDGGKHLVGPEVY